MLTTATAAVSTPPHPHPSGQTTLPSTPSVGHLTTPHAIHHAASSAPPAPVNLGAVAPLSVGPLAVAPAAPATEGGLLNLRTTVILTLTFFIAMTIGTAAGLAAAYSTPHLTVAIGLTAGLAAFFTSFLATAAALHNLISR